jgi:hypothetical protein
MNTLRKASLKARGNYRHPRKRPVSTSHNAANKFVADRCSVKVSSPCGLQQGDVVRSKESPREDLTTHNRSLSDHAPLYAMFILALGLGIVATPLVLLALLLLF